MNASWLSLRCCPTPCSLCPSNAFFFYFILFSATSLQTAITKSNTLDPLLPDRGRRAQNKTPGGKANMQSVTCSALNAASPQNYSFHQNFHPSGLLTFAESHGADEIVFSMFKLAHGSTRRKVSPADTSRRVHALPQWRKSFFGFVLQFHRR